VSPSLTDWLTAVGSLGTFVAVAVAIWTIREESRSREEEALRAQLANVPSAFIASYGDRRLADPIVISGKTYVGVNAVRLRVFALLGDHAFGTGEAAWQRYLDLSASENDTWEHAIAREIANALQGAGLQVLAGGIPVGFALASHAVRFVEDWLLCEAFIRWRQNQDAVTSKTAPDISFQRRHGEWIACASALFLMDRWTGDRLDRLLSLVGTRDEVTAREKALRLADRYLVPKRSQREFRELFGA
jgi:hypothetical protein